MKKSTKVISLFLAFGMGMSVMSSCGLEKTNNPLSSRESSLYYSSFNQENSQESSNGDSTFPNSSRDSSSNMSSSSSSSSENSSSSSDSSENSSSSSGSSENSSSSSDSSENSSSSSDSSENDSSSSGADNSSNDTTPNTPEPPSQKYNTETRPLTIGIGTLEGNFNPFFATNKEDLKVIKQTQLGMLTTDERGNVVYGKEQPTAVLDYKTTMKDALGNVTMDASSAAKTEYEFIIKNGIKFSDGVELTIKDVLFNLYVYLDPAYVGERDLYATDIIGLQAYRQQDSDADDSMSESEFQQQFYAAADLRVNNMFEYLDPDSDYVQPTGDALAQIEKDIATVKRLFLEEVETDWMVNAGTLESYEEEYNFTEDWEVYYFVEGIASILFEQGRPLKTPDGKYVTSLDVEPAYKEAIDAERNDPAKIAAAKEKYGCATDEEAKEYIIRDYAINFVYDTYTFSNHALIGVLSYWTSGANAREEFAAEERSKYFADKSESDKVESISGITTYKTTTDFKGGELGASHDVLKVVINGVDPKAIWNFAFDVAPMHYYSNEEAIENTPFGVKVGDIEFFNSVLKATEKNGKPVGAGVYKASNAEGSGTVTKDNFYRNNWVYFERNTYFDTVGGETITNAKIKYLRYKVVDSNKIVQALEAGDIDFGEPQAIVKNISEVSAIASLNSVSYKTNDYGYVGINPKFVPDIEVRRAIMKAMDTASIVKNYYTEALADVIYRPISKLSWAYPTDVGECESIAYYQSKSEITSLVESAGWEKNASGIYHKNGKTLKITFTIAGETTDHPAYAMFQDAANVLNDCGFDVTVTTDVAGFQKLAMGGLAVWATETESAIDPDLYERYHKDSKVTSVKNWGYDTIFADTTGQFTYEQETINYLSELIEAARETIVESERKEIYAEALDLIMDLAVELPTYQRNDLVVYNKNVINAATLNQTPSANAGVYDRIWEVNYN